MLSLFKNVERRLHVAKVTSWLAYVSLIVSLFADGFVSGTSPALLVIAIIPLLIFLPGLYRADYRSLILLCFVSLLYFTAIVANLNEPDKTFYGAISLVAVVLLFCSAMMYSRWLRAAQLAAQNPESIDTPPPAQ